MENVKYVNDEELRKRIKLDGKVMAALVPTAAIVAALSGGTAALAEDASTIDAVSQEGSVQVVDTPTEEAAPVQEVEPVVVEEYVEDSSTDITDLANELDSVEVAEPVVADAETVEETSVSEVAESTENDTYTTSVQEDGVINVEVKEGQETPDPASLNEEIEQQYGETDGLEVQVNSEADKENTSSSSTVKLADNEYIVTKDENGIYRLVLGGVGLGQSQLEELIAQIKKDHVELANVDFVRTIAPSDGEVDITAKEIVVDGTAQSLQDAKDKSENPSAQPGNKASKGDITPEPEPEPEPEPTPEPEPEPTPEPERHVTVLPQTGENENYVLEATIAGAAILAAGLLLRKREEDMSLDGLAECNVKTF